MKYWTNKEDEILRGFWKKHGSIRTHAHLLPGRSIKSIEKRGWNLKLGDRITWTKEEDRRIREIWMSGYPIKKYLSEFPNRTFGTITSRACTLGLGRRPVKSNGIESAGGKLVMAEIKKGDQTCATITKATGLDRATVYDKIRRMHKNGDIHISAYERSEASGRLVPIYAFGAGKDATYAGSMTSAQKERRRRSLLANGVASGNPFATVMAQVLDVEMPKPKRIEQGTYESRVIRMEEYA